MRHSLSLYVGGSLYFFRGIMDDIHVPVPARIIRHAPVTVSSPVTLMEAFRVDIIRGLRIVLIPDPVDVAEDLIGAHV